MIASHSCCRFFGCTFIEWISRSTTSQRCLIGQRSGGCGGHLSPANSFSSFQGTSLGWFKLCHMVYYSTRRWNQKTWFAGTTLLVKAVLCKWCILAQSATRKYPFIQWNHKQLEPMTQWLMNPNDVLHILVVMIFFFLIRDVFLWSSPTSLSILLTSGINLAHRMSSHCEMIVRCKAFDG